MIQKAIACNTQQQTYRHLQNITSLEELNTASQDPNTIFWLDLLNPTSEELANIARIFNLHPLAVEDATNEHQRPKAEAYDHFYFVVFYTARLDQQNELDVNEIDMFLGKNYLITVHQTPLSELDDLEQRWARYASMLEWTMGVLLYSLLDTIVDNYFPVVDQLVEQAEELEDRMFVNHKREDTITLEILELKKRFLTLRRLAAPERDVLNMLTNRDNPIFDEHVQVYFRDIYDHMTRLADTIDLYRDQISTTMDAHLTIVSNDLNQVMRTLTAASIILMVNSLIAGIYGMNFENMPELKWHFGYFLCLGVMMLLTAGLALFFKRLKWF